MPVPPMSTASVIGRVFSFATTFLVAGAFATAGLAFTFVPIVLTIPPPPAGAYYGVIFEAASHCVASTLSLTHP